MSASTPTLARVLLAATVASFVAVVLRCSFGVMAPVWPGLWENAFIVTELLAVLACVLRAFTGTGHDRMSWAVLAIGLLGFAAADIYYSVVLAKMETPPFPSVADVGYLGIYPCSFVALAILLRGSSGRVPAVLWLDGLTCALGAAALGAALVFGVVATTHGPLATVATNIAYPLGDLAMIAIVIAIATVMRWRARAPWVLVAAGFAVFAVGDSIYLYQTAKDTYREFTPLDMVWPGAFVLLAFAAWQPSIRLDAKRLLNGGALVLPFGVAMSSLGVLVYDHYARVNGLALWLASASVAAVVVRFALTFRENQRMLRSSEHEAATDALTGLGNRRSLLIDLARAVHEAPDRTTALALFDLDGFKSYNDAFGHPAGDALLRRLGANLASTIEGRGTAYRMGGDEFCVLIEVDEGNAAELAAAAATALSDQGERFRIGCSHGLVSIPDETANPSDALRIADQRMYVNKRAGRRSSEETVHEVLLGVVREHDGSLRHHVDDVARLAERVGERLGLSSEELVHLRRAAALHDIGKVAIPDSILHAPRALSEDEWTYMRQHTVIGARIISAAPGLLPVAEIVRSTHERYDGTGYPDGLAGEEIPLAARIVAVCDAFDAMTKRRAYCDAQSVADALAELRRCGGSQFDAQVVDAFVAAYEAMASTNAAASA